MNSTQVPYQVAPILDVTLAALWRDLCVAGEEVVVRKGKRKVCLGGQKKTQDRTLNLPRRPLIFDNDRREWGNKEEQAEISKKTIDSHWVKETFRRLPEGHQASAQAYQNANEYGDGVIPDGYTFVKPHHRGTDYDVAEKTIKVVAQGLQAATLFLNQHKN